MRDAEAHERVAALEGLLEDVEGIADAPARERALAALQAVVELYGSGLERIVAVLSERADAAELAGALSADELVAHLLLLHDLHPVPVEERVLAALAQVRPYLDSHGGDVELLGVEDGVVRLRMEGSCSGCPSSTVTLKLAIEDAIRSAAPEVEAIAADGVEESAPAPLRRRAWTDVATPQLGGGESTLVEVDDEPVLFVKLERALYAYRPSCPACGAAVAAAGGHLVCPDCAARYDVRRAGRAVDGAEPSLEPVPLLHDGNGGVKLALGAPA